MRRVVTVLLAAGLLWVLSASPGAAQSAPQLIVGPQTGSIYATFSIIGTECSQPATGSWNVYTATGNTSLVTGGVAPNTNGVWDDSFSGSALPGLGDYRLEADCGGVAYTPATFTLIDAPGPGMTVTPTSGTVDDGYVFQGTSCQVAENGSWKLYEVAGAAFIAAGPTAANDFGVWEDGFPDWPDEPPVSFGVGEFRLEANCGSLIYDPVTFTVAEVQVDAPATPTGPVQTRPAFTG